MSDNPSEKENEFKKCLGEIKEAINIEDELRKQDRSKVNNYLQELSTRVADIALTEKIKHSDQICKIKQLQERLNLAIKEEDSELVQRLLKDISQIK